MPRARNSATRSYPNRSDLTRPATVTAAPGQPYGAAGQQRAAQAAQPMGPQPVAGAPSNQPSMDDIAQLMQQHAQTTGITPGQHMQAPTARPNEPVTHGIPVGAGAGPEALTGVGAATRDNTIQQGTLQNLLTNLASQPQATDAIRRLAVVAQSGAQ